MRDGVAAGDGNQGNDCAGCWLLGQAVGNQLQCKLVRKVRARSGPTAGIRTLAFGGHLYGYRS